MSPDPGGPGPPSPAAVAAVPKAELHVHLEATALPQLIRALAARNGRTLPAELFTPDGRFAWRDFLHFLQHYDVAASAIRTAQDYRDVTFAYLERCAAEGAVYVELIASPDHARAVGLPESEHRAGIAQGIDDARAASGIQARFLVVGIRNLGVEAVERVAAEAAADPHPYLVGFNLAGAEVGFPPEDYARAFAIAHDAGLGCSIHAGEHAPPAVWRGALDLPGITRISHGVRAVEDPELVARLAAEGIVLEVCPTSNIALGVYPDADHHPLGALRRAGVRVTLGSDDPPWFGATLGGEYALAARHQGCSEADLADITRTAIRAAFADEATRDALLAVPPLRDGQR